jgi:hypothetical protein
MTKTKSFNIPLALAAGLLFVGYIFKIHHWPYAFQIEAIGYIMIACLYTTRFSFKSDKNLKDTIKLILVTSWCITSILAPIKMPYVFLLQILVATSGIIWLVLEFVDLAKKKTNALNKVLFFGGLLLAVEAVCRFQYWPGAVLLHLLALIVIIIGFSIDNTFNKIKN